MLFYFIVSLLVSVFEYNKNIILLTNNEYSKIFKVYCFNNIRKEKKNNKMVILL